MTNRKRLRLLALLIVALVAAWAGPVHAVSNNEPKIIDGRDASPGEYPWMVSLGEANADSYDGHFCGGSVLTEIWILTAAHCTEGAEPASIVVTSGTHDLSVGGVRTAVDEIVDHPEYTGGVGLANDISLLRLEEPIDAPTIRVVEAHPADGTVATLTGWGDVTPDPNEEEYPNILQEVEFPTVSDVACEEELGEEFIAAVNFCAGAPQAEPDSGPDACQGDSGGPLMVREGEQFVQAGIVSFGPTCGMTFSGYTRLVNYGEFILTTIGGDPPPPPPPGQFSDIAGSVHEDAIEAVAGAGIAGGFPDGTYRPASPVTRGQMATFLSRALDLPSGQAGSFPDVAGNVHEDAINAVAAAGIAGGFSDGTYRPDEEVSRGQMATFLSRALDLPSGEPGSFPDVAGNVHELAIGAVAETGIAGGFPDGTYRPDDDVNRGQMATFLNRAFLT